MRHVPDGPRPPEAIAALERDLLRSRHPMVTGARKLPLTISPGRQRLVIQESGTSALSPRNAESFDETFAVLQMRGETTEAFVERARERLALFRRDNCRLVATTLKLNARVEPNVGEARRDLLLALVHHARDCGGLSEVCIEVTSPPDSFCTDLALLSLVDTVLAQAPPELSIVVRFGTADAAGPELDSGVSWPNP